MIQLFGTTFMETVNAFRPGHLAATEFIDNDKIKAIARIGITILLLLLASYLVTNEGADAKIGTGIIGAITGYWLK